MNYYDLLLAKNLNGGGGGSTTIQELNVSANGTYSAPTGTAYSPVNVNVGGDALGELLADTLSEYSNSVFSGAIPIYMFASKSNLISVSIPKANTIGSSAFQNASKMTNINLSGATMIYANAFSSC